MACTNMSLAPCSTLTVQIKQGDEPATCILDQIIGEANVIDQRDLQGDTCRVINQHGLASYQQLLPNCNTSSSDFLSCSCTHTKLLTTDQMVPPGLWILANTIESLEHILFSGGLQFGPAFPERVLLLSFGVYIFHVLNNAGVVILTKQIETDRV